MKKRAIVLLIMSSALMCGCGESARQKAADAYMRSSEIPPATVTSVTGVTSGNTAQTETDASKSTAAEPEVSTSSAKVSKSVARIHTSAKAKEKAKPTETEVPPTSAAQTSSKALTSKKAQSNTKTQTTQAKKKAISQSVTTAKASASITTTTVTEQKQESFDTFYGVLIDEDCSDFEDPPMHDTECMFMEECRASGYGLDIEQSDGAWVFYMFDDNGQSLAWEYLNFTKRDDGLFVTVTGKWEDGEIKVISITES